MTKPACGVQTGLVFPLWLLVMRVLGALGLGVFTLLSPTRSPVQSLVIIGGCVVTGAAPVGRRWRISAIEHRIAHYTGIAANSCPSLGSKTITAHVLRHTCAMRLLLAGVDTSVIALCSATSASKRPRSTSTPSSA